MPKKRYRQQQPAKGVFYRFLNFHFEPDAALLRDGKTTLHLSPKEMDLLTILIKEHGRLVSHRDIWTTLWPSQDVSYESLTRCVYGLRRGLGEQGNEIIQSVPRRGYTFAAPTKEIAPTPRVNSVIEKSIQTAPAAYALYQQGLHRASIATQTNQRKAIELFKRAHEIDPLYSVPLGAIAEISMYQSIRGYLSPSDSAKQASGVITRALDIDPDLVSALSAKGWFEAAYYGDMQSAMQHFDRAQQLDPNHGMTYFTQGWMERSTGQVEKAVATLQQGAKVDPLHLNIAHALAFSLFYAGRTEEALEMERRYTTDMPDIDNGHFYQAIFASWLGLHKEAIKAAKTGLKASPRETSGMTVLSYALARAGFGDKARAINKRAQAGNGPPPIPIFLASSHLALGDEDSALSLLQQARGIKSPWLPLAEFDPRLASLRDNPEFHALFTSG